jgi:hypothetical protein
MQAALWLSDRCFDCAVERIEPAAGGWIVKTRARRYFRFDTASAVLLRRMMALKALDMDDPAHAMAVAFLHHRLVPLGIYTPRDAASAATRAPTGTSGTMRWSRQLLSARQVRPLAAALSPMFSPWALGIVIALCLWFHGVYALHSLQQIGYRDLLSYSPSELLLLVLASALRSLVHELGHAAACWRLTRSVGAIGYGVFITTPVLYCDVSDIHLLPRRSKALVGLAGIAMDIVFLALLAGLAGSELIVMKVYWISLVAVLLNLVPFYRNDGFWVLNDLAGSDDLLKQSLAAVRRGRATVGEWAMLGFTAACLVGVAWLGVVFARDLGPQQLADAWHHLPAAAGVVLGVITSLQYAALVFGLLSAVKAALGIAGRLRRRHPPA